MDSTKQSKINIILFGTQTPFSLAAGIGLALSIMLAALLSARWLNKMLPFEKGVLSPIFMAIIFGLVIRNTLPLPSIFEPGIQFGIRKLLRLGIILMGIRLSIFALLKVGIMSLGLILVCVIAALAITDLVAKRIGISSKLGALVAAGTSICGVSAIMATSPVIEAGEEETAYAVATITFFGILATIIYPYLTELVFRLDTAQAGFFLGTSVHDTAQSTASSMIYDQLWKGKTSGGITAADIAITTKLVRNTFMIAVIPFLGYRYARDNAKKITGKIPSWTSVIPFFVFGFIIMGAVRSLGDYGIGADNAWWKDAVHFIKESAKYLIAIAVACIGLNTNIRKLLTLGLKPFLCGLIAAASVGGVSLLLVSLFENYLRL